MEANESLLLQDPPSLMADRLTNYRSPFLEFLPIFSQVKKDKDVGAFEDLVEGLKVYDKLENGCMLAAELNHVLLFLGKCGSFK